MKELHWRTIHKQCLFLFYDTLVQSLRLVVRLCVHVSYTLEYDINGHGIPIDDGVQHPMGVVDIDIDWAPTPG